jgi:methylmalonyl-CoA mutase N-terminal domain/subunit
MHAVLDMDHYEIRGMKKELWPDEDKYLTRQIRNIQRGIETINIMENLVKKDVALIGLCYFLAEKIDEILRGYVFKGLYREKIDLVRVTMQGLAAILGGTQSLHTNSFDEALCLPTEKAVRIALRTQQIIAYESGAADTVDPLAGSYYVEWLTNKMEKEAEEYFERIEEFGGVIPAIKANFFQREIANASYKYQKEVENKERIIVGVNKYRPDEEIEPDILKIDDKVAVEQKESLKKVKKERDNELVEETLSKLKKAAEGTENLMPYIIECVRAYASVGEIIGTLKKVFGTYKEDSIF